MQNDVNVVYLIRVVFELLLNVGVGCLLVIFVQVCDKVVLQLKQVLQVLFDNVDDIFFEMVD